MVQCTVKKKLNKLDFIANSWTDTPAPCDCKFVRSPNLSHTYYCCEWSCLFLFLDFVFTLNIYEDRAVLDSIIQGRWNAWKWSSYAKMVRVEVTKFQLQFIIFNIMKYITKEKTSKISVTASSKVNL